MMQSANGGTYSEIGCRAWGGEESVLGSFRLRRRHGKTSCCLSGKTLYWRSRDIGPIRWGHADGGENMSKPKVYFRPG